MSTRTETEDADSIFTIAINSLAFRTLNFVPYEPSESTAEAIDCLNEWVRKGSLAIALGLNEIALALRERSD